MGNAVQLEIMSLFNLESLLLLAASTLAGIIIGVRRPPPQQPWKASL